MWFVTNPIIEESVYLYTTKINKVFTSGKTIVSTKTAETLLN